jgi:hypothetical protein
MFAYLISKKCNILKAPFSYQDYINEIHQLVLKDVQNFHQKKAKFHHTIQFIDSLIDKYNNTSGYRKKSRNM